jgi:hypothetical protein
MNQPDFSSLQTILVTSKLQQSNNALFQVITELIKRTGQSQSATISRLNEIEESISAVVEEIEENQANNKETYLTVNDETVNLSNSRQLLAGLSTFFNDATAGKRTIDVISFPVGSIFSTFVNTNPSILLGYGTWTLFATGRGSSGNLLEIRVI